MPLPRPGAPGRHDLVDEVAAQRQALAQDREQREGRWPRALSHGCQCLEDRTSDGIKHHAGASGGGNFFQPQFKILLVGLREGR